ncbi:pheromone A receptor-domain-containing protein [Melanogaster broomeanus]|nr:pheromone A receptor-domain-containing protein [Melanogaster broomeanus]
MQAEIPVISLISAGLVLVPLIWYLRARNIAAVAIGIWLSVTNIIYAVDALIWADNSDLKAPLWCDISTSFIIGSHIALPAACLCICIHLERLASFCQISTRVATQSRILFESVTCFGLPAAYIALHLIVQPRRFDLFYGFGCRPATYPAVIAICLVWVPLFVLAFLTIWYAAIAWRHFLVHGVQFSRGGTRSSASFLTCNMYIRLVGMAVSEVVLSIVLTAIAMWYTISQGLAPMADMSRHLDEVLMWGSEAMTDTIRIVLMAEWTGVVAQSVLFFGLFACRMEVLSHASRMVRQFPHQFGKRHGDALFGRIRSSYVKASWLGIFADASLSLGLRQSCQPRYLTLRRPHRTAAPSPVTDIPWRSLCHRHLTPRDLLLVPWMPPGRSKSLVLIRLCYLWSHRPAIPPSHPRTIR